MKIEKGRIEMKFEVETDLDIEDIIREVSDCEGNHIQQVVFSTYHKALTQICFGCKKIRTMLSEEDLREKEE